MTSTSDRARRAYRLGRLRVGAVGAMPSLAYLFASAVLGADRHAFAVGFAMLFVSAAFVYLGRSYARGIGLGFVLGIVPFATASFAQGAGHVCLDGACMSVCAPMCTAAGLVTGLVGSWLTVRLRGGLGAFAAMSSVVVFAGAMGCRCIGYGSVAGLVTGLVVASIPAWPRLVAGSRA